MIPLPLLARPTLRIIRERDLSRAGLARTLAWCARNQHTVGNGRGLVAPVLGRDAHVWSARELFDIVQHNYLALTAYRALPGVRTVVDAGAHVGLISLLFARLYPGATIHSIEPDPANFDLLAQNTRGLPLIHAHQAALSGPGVEAVTLHRQDTQTGTIAADMVQRSGGESVQVRALDVAAIQRLVGEPIDLLKLDIEGAEYDFLAGLPREGGPRHLYIEFHIPAFRRWADLQTAVASLEAAGYRRRWRHVTTYPELDLDVCEMLLSR